MMIPTARWKRVSWAACTTAALAAGLFAHGAWAQTSVTPQLRGGTAHAQDAGPARYFDMHEILDEERSTRSSPVTTWYRAPRAPASVSGSSN